VPFFIIFAADLEGWSGLVERLKKLSSFAGHHWKQRSSVY